MSRTCVYGARVGAAELEVRRLAADGVLDHRLDRADVLVHAEPVHGRGPDRPEVEAERLPVGEEHRLGGGLRRAVEVGARARVGEQDRVVPVDRLVEDARQHADRGEVDEARHPERDHRLDEVEDAADVHLEGGRPVRREVRGIEDHAGVHDLVRPVDAEDVEHARLVADRGELERERVDVVAEHEARLRDEAAHVEDDDLAPGVEQRPHEVAADEPCAAGDERRPIRDRLALRRARADVDLGSRHALRVARVASGAHPCTAPSVRPRTRCRWTRIPSRIAGISETIVSAAAWP